MIHNIHILILNDNYINVISKTATLTERHYCSTIVLQCFMNMFQGKILFCPHLTWQYYAFYISVMLIVQ